MIQALLHGKLSREQENMEDLLTSNVFGLLQYAPPEHGLMPFLGLARLEKSGGRPLANVQCMGTVEYTFWPWLTEDNCIPCEPDVALRFTDKSGQKHLVMVEAKYKSGKSSHAVGEDEQSHPSASNLPNDQLAREYDNLLSVASRENREPLLVYLTAGTKLPLSEIKESEHNFRKKARNSRGACTQFRCAWLSWRHLYEVFGKANHRALQHLIDLAKRLNLFFFKGVTPINPLPNAICKFVSDPVTFKWDIRPLASFRWSLRSPLIKFHWSFGPTSSAYWSFNR